MFKHKVHTLQFFLLSTIVETPTDDRHSYDLDKKKKFEINKHLNPYLHKMTNCLRNLKFATSNCNKKFYKQ